MVHHRRTRQPNLQVRIDHDQQSLGSGDRRSGNHRTNNQHQRRATQNRPEHDRISFCFVFVVRSPIAPRSKRKFAERTTTVIDWPILRRTRAKKSSVFRGRNARSGCFWFACLSSGDLSFVVRASAGRMGQLGYPGKVTFRLEAVLRTELRAGDGHSCQFSRLVPESTDTPPVHRNRRGIHSVVPWRKAQESGISRVFRVFWWGWQRNDRRPRRAC